jgi:hypothetical protein
MKRTISRRMFLRSATGALLALPLLDDVAHAQTAPIKRLIVIFTPNGTVPEAWTASGSGPTFKLGSIMTPLADHQQDLVVLPNLDMSVALDGPGGDAHALGLGCLLTGTELLAGDQFKAGMGGPGSGWPGGISVDQYIASKVGQTTKFRSLEFALKRAPGTIWTRISYSGPSQPIAPFDDPQIAFDQIFGDMNLDPAILARRAARRKTVLNGVSNELRTLGQQLSGSDKRKVEAHLDQISDIESRLNILGSSNGCLAPARPTLSASQEVLRNDSGMEIEDPNAHADVPLRQTVWRQLMVAALACDLTRVTSFIMAPSRSDIFMSWLNISRSHHDLSHDGGGVGTASGDKLVLINQWYAARIADLIAALKASKEGSGSMFDNTVLLWANELGVGSAHSHTQIPFMLAGSAGGYFKTGRSLSIAPGTSHNALLISLCNAMGLPDTTFGNPKHCHGPLPGLAA